MIQKPKLLLKRMLNLKIGNSFSENRSHLDFFQVAFFLGWHKYINVMIKLCPFCGRPLSSPLSDGITSCDNCCRVFDSSSYYRTLSCSWVVRRWHIEDAEVLKQKFGFLEDEVLYVEKYVIEQGYTHDEFVSILNSLVDKSA